MYWYYVCPPLTSVVGFNQSINQSANQSISQQTYQSFNQSVNHLINQSIKKTNFDLPAFFCNRSTSAPQKVWLVVQCLILLNPTKDIINSFNSCCLSKLLQCKQHQISRFNIYMSMMDKKTYFFIMCY